MGGEAQKILKIRGSGYQKGTHFLYQKCTKRSLFLAKMYQKVYQKMYQKLKNGAPEASNPMLSFPKF